MQIQTQKYQKTRQSNRWPPSRILETDYPIIGPDTIRPRSQESDHDPIEDIEEKGITESSLDRRLI